MNRFPLRSRGVLLAVVSGVAGVFLALGFVADEVDHYTAIAVAFVAVLADLGLVRDSEGQVTPVADPLGNDGLPLVGWRDAEALANGETHGEDH